MDPATIICQGVRLLSTYVPTIIEKTVDTITAENGSIADTE